MKTTPILSILFCCIGIISCLPPPTPPPPPPPNNNELFRKATDLLIETGLDYALENPLVPMEAKIAIGTSRAVTEGVRKFSKTKSFVHAGKAVAASALDSTNKILLPEYSMYTRGTAVLAKDVYDGKEKKTAIKDRVKEGIYDSIPGGSILQCGIEHFSENPSDEKYNEARKQLLELLNDDVKRIDSLPESSKSKNNSQKNKKMKQKIKRSQRRKKF
ncbi:uncharacterized protein LOC116339838 [Contarinia nasturtii]|uniref:uncharacterized protein LOC116339838 n=1 Tax=Contarinia nasturtii TaxID=265458 RepID=UPI0012D3C9FD|nr:uncharacterized protein LOC116339838 [Contarinia nasturtii]